ncbi:cytidine deaminase [Fulvivirga sp. M361]|uniref:cytidine deaminase n=1 Tax=Fulvivirga sp. M361 TaxID=2594266 RepID=UPI00117A0248|nr:cytidine deaminase [Fulvivirga sp. M361]TRX57754.1 cytidine deaminase [Fulvivirga sp. M361]
MEGFNTYTNEGTLDPYFLKLINRARSVTNSSYSPYSNYRVGAALLLENGQILTGSNQENASYPAGLCAERVALFYAASSYPDQVIKAVAVVARSARETEFKPVSPCGICRQVVLEYEMKQGVPIQLIFQTQDKQWIITKNSRVLLPFCFDRDNL